MPKLYVEPMYKDSKFPTKATELSAAFDLYAYIKKEHAQNYEVILAGETKIIPIGIKLRPESGYCIKLYPRSGLALKHDIALGNCVGIGDEDFSHQYQAIIHNHGNNSYVINHEDRICQIMLEKVEEVELEIVDKLPPVISSRKGGFGHTGN